jgi:hypothetical protein
VFPKIDCLIQNDLRRDILTVKELKNRHPEDGPVNGRDPIEPPIFRILLNQPINLLTVVENTLNHPLKKGIFPLIQKVLFEMIKTLSDILLSDVPLIKKL